MKKKILFLMMSIFIIGMFMVPAFGMSELAEDFLTACRALDAKFPPPAWEREDLHKAALEVLNECESGRYEKWPVSFCLIALGRAQYPEDLPRIIAYKDDMISTVLRALRGFPHPDAINFLLKHVENKSATKREIAIKSLAEIDFKKVEDGDKWREKVLDAIHKVQQKEKVVWLRKDIDKAIEKIEASTSQNK